MARCEAEALERRVDLPELAPPEQALLQRFRADQSPSAGVVRRVEARLAARLEAGDADVALPLAPVLPFAYVGKAAMIACALAAAVLLVLGGSARLVHAVRTSATATQASDLAAPTTQGGRAQPTAPAAELREAAPTVVPDAPVVPLPPAPTPAPAIDLAAVPGALDAPRKDGSVRPTPRPGPVAESAKTPTDAAAEIDFLTAARLERDPERRLAKLRDYSAKFQGGALGEEVAVLEIESLCQLGRTELAAQKSAAFLRQHPDSAYAGIPRRGCSREGGRR